MQRSVKITHRVAYSEVDKMGIVYHSIYLSWFEIARVEWMRQNGIIYKELEKNEIFLPVISIKCEYRLPVEYDDIVEVEVSPISFSSRKVTFQGKVLLKNKEAVTSEITLICVNKERKVIHLPESLKNILKETCS